ncbi:MAG: protein-disulfide reductase DsbD [Campylobacter sp.]|nr:protein-disulfide reductase DsbD [Campylobacter sp.]
MLRFFIVFFIFLTQIFAEPLSVDEAVKITPSVANSQIEFKFSVNESTYLYADEIKFKFENSDITPILNLPTPKPHKHYQIYNGEFSIFIPLGVVVGNGGNLENFEIQNSFNACTFDGFCYEPQIRHYTFSKFGDNYKITKTAVASSNFNAEFDEFSQEEKIANSFSQKSFFGVILLFFGYGVLLSLTPCVFPLIPILSSIIVAKTAQKNDTKKSFFISFVYVFAMALAYALIGASVGFFGANLADYLQIPAVILAFCAIFVILALSMFGFFEIKIPQILKNKTNANGGIIDVFIMGFLSVLIVSPCASAVLAGALLYIATSGNVALGASALFALGLGSGVLLLAIGLGLSLPRPGEWMNFVSKIFGFLLLFMAIWLGSRVFGENFALLLYGALGCVFAVFLGLFDKSANLLKKGISLFVLLYSILLLIGFASGAKDFAKPLENFSIAKENFSSEFATTTEFKKVSNLSELNEIINSAKKPVLIDFWASWCKTCKELESDFNDENIASNLAKFELIKVDLTNPNAQNTEIKKEFSVFSPPVLMFFENGKELKNLKISGYESDKDKAKLTQILQEF